MLTQLLATVASFGTLLCSVNANHNDISPRQAAPSKDNINATAQEGANVVLEVSTKTGCRNATGRLGEHSAHKHFADHVAPLLYGWMIEDINHSIEGGLYAEMITNRAFQGMPQTVNVAVGVADRGLGSTVTLGTIDGFDGTYVVGSENSMDPFGPVLTGYRSIGGARLSLDRLHPLSDALPMVMQVDIPLNATGEVGFLNEGWWGMVSCCATRLSHRG